MAFGLRDIILAIQLRLNPGAAQAVQTQIANAIAGGTQQGVGAPGVQAAQQTYVSTWQKALNRIYAMMLATFGVRAVYNFLEGSIMAFAKFDQKLQQSIAIMDNVNSIMRDKLAITARQVSKELNIAAEDLASVYYYLAEAGFTAEQSLKALPITAIFAKAGLIELAKATEYLAQANTALGYRSDDATQNMLGMQRVADVLARVSKTAQGSIENFAQALTNKAGNSLRLFGKDVEEGAAALAVLANQGTKGAVAGERLDIFLRQGAQAATKHADAFKAYGIQIFDTNGKMRNLADISDDLTKALGNLSDEQQVIALQQLGFQTRTVAFVKAFIGQGDAIRAYEKSLRSAGGYAETVAKKQLLTPIEQFGLFQKKIADVRREIGESFIKSLLSLGSKLGDENDPTSIVGVLRIFAKWLGENQFMIEGLAMAIKLAVYIFIGFFEVMNKVADVIVMLTAGPVFLLAEGFNLLTITIAAVLKPLGMFISFISGGMFHEIEDFADMLFKLQRRIDAFGVSAGQAALNAGKDFLKPFGSGLKLDPPKHVDTKLGSGTTKNNADQNRTGKALGLPTEEDIKRGKSLMEELTAFMAKHTATREDDQLASLAKLERKFHDFYGKTLPKNVKSAFEEIRMAIADETVASGYAHELSVMEKVGVTPAKMQGFINRMMLERSMLDVNSKAWAEYTKIIEQAQNSLTTFIGRGIGDRLDDIMGAEDAPDKVQALHDFREEMRELMADTAEGSDEWEVYHDAADRAWKALVRLQKQLSEQDQRDNKEKRDKDAERMLRRIERIGEHTARTMADAFGAFFEVLFIGTKRGSDAFEQLGRKIAASGIGAISEWAMAHSKADFIHAADETWKGIAAASDPFLAWSAPGHFAAAAQAAAAGSAWAALGGSLGGAASSLGGSNHGLRTGNAGETGANRVDESTAIAPEINIYIDGVDPKNPRHQNLIGQTVREYADRGGKITVYDR